jgi:hypothetical protein
MCEQQTLGLNYLMAASSDIADIADIADISMI